MAKKFKSVWFVASRGAIAYEKSGVFGKKEVQEQSVRYPKFGDYAQKLAEAYEDLDDEGYDVVNVVPIAMGESEPYWGPDQVRYTGNVGFSITRGAVVIGKKRTD